MLAMMALGALLAVGSAGPVLAMVALMLPPDSKSFGLSAFHCVVSVIDPSASVVLGVVLQARPEPACAGCTFVCRSHVVTRTSVLLSLPLVAEILCIPHI